MVTIFNEPEKFKFSIGDIVFYTQFCNGRAVMFSGVIRDGWINDGYEDCPLYTVNDVTKDEEDLFRSVEDYKAFELSESREDYYERLHSIYVDVEDRNQLLADFIMKSRMVNGNTPEKFTIKLPDEKSIVRNYMYDEREFVTKEIVDKFTITKNDEGEYEFCFIDVKYGFTISSGEVIHDAELIINLAMEEYISKLNETI